MDINKFDSFKYVEEILGDNDDSDSDNESIFECPKCKYSNIDIIEKKRIKLLPTAINIKIKGIPECTCLIFRSGSIIITGGNDVNEYLEIYKKIIKLFEENYEDVLF